jgi:diacylglycerol kinase family enzyme
MLVAPEFFAKFFNLARGIFHLALIYNNLTRVTGDYTITTYRKTVLIYNPRAGKFGRDGGALIDRAVEILKKSGHNIIVAPTTGPETAGAIAREHMAGGADLVVAAGGDGTINEVAEGMVHSRVPLAILPGGTANVLAMEMKAGRNLERVALDMDEWRPHRISVGHICCQGGRVSRHFLLMAGIGLDAHVVRHVNPGLKARTGKLAYWVAGLSLLGRNLTEFHVDVAGHRHKCSFALLSKVKNYGGSFEVARNVSLLDDHLEVVLMEGRSALRYVKYLTGLMLNRLSGMQGVTILRADRAVISCPGDATAYVHIDGELVGLLPAEIRMVPDALTLLMPDGYAAGSKPACRD